MKTLITLIITLSISIISFAQQGINYKAVVKDTNGNLLSDTFMNVQFTIHQSTATGTIVYQEDHNYTTDSNGLVILNIGTDTAPSVGVFEGINWGTDQHFLQITITYSGGTINFDATEFMAVPYAKHAKTAATAENVFSGNYNDLTNQPTITNPTGLEKITEYDGVQNNTGWRLKGFNPDAVGPIGDDAVDLSISGVITETNGALGRISFACGLSTSALGDYSFAAGIGTEAIENRTTAFGQGTAAIGLGSTAMGQATNAIGRISFALGNRVNAHSYAETVFGQYNSGYNPNSTTEWNPDDRLFVIGNGINNNNPNNAMTILKNGNIGIGRPIPSSLLEVAHLDGPPTSSNRTNAFSIRNLGTGRSWQMYTEDNGYLLLFNDGNYRGSFNASTGAYGSVSDRRVKKDIIPLEAGILNKIMQLEPVSYIMKSQADNKRQLGLISQDVKQVFPGITNYIEDHDLMEVSYTELIPILIKAMQEQQSIIERQNIQIKTLSTDNASLQKTVNNLIVRVEKIEANNQ